MRCATHFWTLPSLGYIYLIILGIFSDNVSKQVKMIGQNSGYLFYVPEGQKTVSITPIGQVKEIKKL